MHHRRSCSEAISARAALMLAALALLDHNTDYALAADDDAWQGTVTVVESSHSESDKTDVLRPINEENCSSTERHMRRARMEKTTTYSGFQLLPDTVERTTKWRGTARANVTLDKSDYTLDVTRNAPCFSQPSDSREQGYETTTSGSGVGQGEVMFFRLAEPGSREATCNIEADVEKEVAVVPEVGRRWDSKGEKPVKQQHSLLAGAVFSTNFSFACDPRSSSYSGRQRIEMNPDGNDIKVVTWDIRRGPGKAAAVAIDGCAHLGIGKTAKLTATGRPPGGAYKWYGMPVSVLEVTETGPNVTVTPLKAGRALILVEYRPPGGGVAEARVSGSVAEVRAVNGGAALPEIGLKDENGHTPPPVRVPVDQAPPEGDLVSYPVADPAVASVLNEGPSLLIQGVRVGKTTAQAQTACKQKTGPEFAIEVVRCTKETRERQFEKEKEAVKRVLEDAEKAREALEGENLEEAAKKLPEHTADAFAKLSELLLSLTSGAGHGTAESLEHGLEAAGKLYTAWKMMQGNTEASAILLALINPSTEKVAAKVELYESWKEYLHDLDTILSALDKWNEAMQRMARHQEDLDLLQRRHESICGKKPGEGEPPPPPTPPGRTPAPTVTPVPPGPTPAPQEPTPVPPVPTAVPPKPTGVPPGPTPRQVPPSQPTAPPSTTGGFPYLACGCQTYTTSAWTKSAPGLTAVGTDLSKTQSCAKQFAGRVETLGKDLQSFGDAFTQAQQAAGLPREQGLIELGSAIDTMKTSLSGISSFGKDAGTVKSSLGGCGGTTNTVGAIIGAVNVTEPSTKPTAIPDTSGRK